MTKTCYLLWCSTHQELIMIPVMVHYILGIINVTCLGAALISRES